MAAGLGFKTFTTGEVLTAADTNGYLMQGILVFASAAARDAAITSPQEGQACYLKDTDQVLSYSGSTWVAVGGGSPLTTKGDLYTFSTVDARLGVGTNGQVLTADSTAATGLAYTTISSGGMTLLSTTALSGTSTTITGISQAFTDLVIYMPAFTYSAAADFSFKTGDTSLSGNYYFQRQKTTVFSFNAAAARVNSDMSTAAPQGIYIRINRYSDSARHGIYAIVLNAAVGDVAVINGYDYATLTGMSQIQISSVAGTSTMSAGSVFIFGVK